ncbi:MAG: hypothetical protein ACLFSB_05800 [Chitinispirillaceae bacterium]
MKTKAYILFTILILFSLFGCMQSPVSSVHNGSGSDVEACLIRSQVLDSAQRPIPGAVVKLRRSDFLYDSTTALNKRVVVHSDTVTDDSGYFSLPDVDSGNYHIEIRDQHAYATLYTCTVNLGDSVINLPPRTLEAMGSLKLSLPPGSSPLRVHIAGLDRYADLVDSVSFRVPEGRYSIIIRDDQQHRLRIDEIPVQSGAQKDIGTINPETIGTGSSQDSSVISEILTVNGFSSPPEGFEVQRDAISARVTGMAIQDVVLESLPPAIGQLSELCSLSIRDAQLDWLPEEIGYLKNCTKLNLDNNNLDSLPWSIGSLPHLRVLSITNNRLTRLPRSIEQLTKLEALYACFNRLSEIPPSLQTLPELKILDISVNWIDSFPAASSIFPKLQHLYFKSNYLATLPEQIMELPRIRTLAVDFNMLCSLPDTLSIWMDEISEGWQNTQNCLKPYHGSYPWGWY